MRAWKEYLIEDPQTLADEMHRIAGYHENEELSSIIKDVLGGTFTINIGPKKVGYSSKDLKRSRSCIDYLIKRARPRKPISRNILWGSGELLFSISARKGVFKGISITNGHLDGIIDGYTNHFFTQMKHDNFRLTSSNSDGFNPQSMNEAIQNVVEGFVEDGWREKTGSMLKTKRFPMPEMSGVEFAKGDYSFGEIPSESDVRDLIETVVSAQKEVMVREKELWQVTTEISFEMNEVLMTSNYHEEPIRRIVPKTSIGSHLNFPLKDGSFPRGKMRFHGLRILGGFKDILGGMDSGESDKFVENAARVLYECKNLESINKYGKKRIRAIMKPNVAGVFGHEVCHNAEADEYLDSFEWMVDSWKIGKKFFSENFTVRDVPHDISLYGYTPFDELGMISKEKILIRNGKLSDRLYGFDGAGYLEDKYENLENLVDGHSFEEGLVRMTNTVIDVDKDGPSDIDEMIEISRANSSRKKPIIVFGAPYGGGNWSGYSMQELDVGICYLIPDGKRWEDRIPLGYPSRPNKPAILKFDDIGFGRAIKVIVGSSYEDEIFCLGGSCGKGEGEYSFSWHDVGFKAPMISIETKFLTHGEMDSEGEYLPPLIPTRF